MNTKQYMTCLRRKLIQYFDFRDTDSFKLFSICLFAEHKRSSEKFFFTKRINLYRIENFEYVIVTEVEHLTMEQLETYYQKIREGIPEIVNPTSGHMSSIVTLVLLTAEPVKDGLAKHVKTLKYHKDFFFTLRGWADLALLVVSLTDGVVYANDMGKKVKQPYERILKENGCYQSEREFC